MNKCVICDRCSNVFYFQPPNLPPVKCPYDGNPFLRFNTPMNEDDPRVLKIVKNNRGTEESVEDKKNDDHGEKKNSLNEKKYCLKNLGLGIVLHIPLEGGIVGRTAIGGEEFANNEMISREHLRITPAKRGMGVNIEDISSNGTLINGREMIKNKEEFIPIGAEVTLYNETFVLEVDDEE